MIAPVITFITGLPGHHVNRGIDSRRSMQTCAQQNVLFNSPPSLQSNTEMHSMESEHQTWDLIITGVLLLSNISYSSFRLHPNIAVRAKVGIGYHGVASLIPPSDLPTLSVVGEVEATISIKH